MMDKVGVAALIGFVASLVYLSLVYDTSFAFERPFQSSIAIFASSGIAIIGLQKVAQGLWSGQRQDGRYIAIALEDRGQSQSPQGNPPAPLGRLHEHSPRTLRVLFVLLVAALCFRVEVLRRVVLNVQCAAPTVEALIPFLLALVNLWMTSWHRTDYIESLPDDSTYQAIGHSLVNSRFRYILPSALLSLGSLLVSHTSPIPTSSYICARILANARIVPHMQFAGFLLDLFIVITLTVFAESFKGDLPTKGSRIAATSGWALLISSMILCTGGMIAFYNKPEDRYWILTPDSTYLWSLVKFCFTVTLCIICGLLTISRLGFFNVIIIVLFTCSYIQSLASALQNSRPFPPMHSGTLVAIFMLFAGVTSYVRIDLASGSRSSSSGRHNNNRSTTLIYLLFCALFLARVSVWFKHASQVSYHPIDMLMYDAKLQHDEWLERAGRSDNLKAAVEEYRERYKRPPPPRFKEWYEFARSKDSIIYDNFDSIHQDLLPFWSLSPEEIRSRTWESISNPWNDIAGISIRGGQAEITPNVNVVPDHRWMLEGAIAMIEKFSEWLPDMDLALNLNDECRVAVLWHAIESMRNDGLHAGDPDGEKHNEFSEARASGWKAIPEDPIAETPFHERSYHETFYEFGSIGCAPSSRARNEFHWNVHDLCTTCTYPHSLGQFLSNWTLAADICHQPDVRKLHGFELSPAAFKASHDLTPVFSQSKVHGYNDILYPSPWNYMEKVAYRPTDDNPDKPFQDKETTLFWRGATSEGVSPGTGTWLGMTRQRLVHLANKGTTNTPVLLPRPTARSEDKKKLAYTYLTPSELHSLDLRTDIHIVDAIARCIGADCITQHQELSPLAPPIDFQAHWRYKYLLDLDGAGFSGRFLPFLHSRSLVFKSALFREWWDGRVTAWRHFVPLDMRLHGLWSTLAYFRGVDASVRGMRVEWKRHDREAEWIAEEGRRWAGMVLRKEDMEVYMFRLLLEWGRLTDDRRDELGFVVDGEEGE